MLYNMLLLVANALWPLKMYCCNPNLCCQKCLVCDLASQRTDEDLQRTNEEMHYCILYSYTVILSMHVFSFTYSSSQHYLTRSQSTSSQNRLVEPIWPAQYIATRPSWAWKELCVGNWRMLRINVCSIGCAGHSVLWWWINDEEEEGPSCWARQLWTALCVSSLHMGVCVRRADRTVSIVWIWIKQE